MKLYILVMHYLVRGQTIDGVYRTRAEAERNATFAINLLHLVTGKWHSYHIEEHELRKEEAK